MFFINLKKLSQIFSCITSSISISSERVKRFIFDGLDTELEKAISDIENNHATMDNEAIKLIGDIKEFAAKSEGLGEDIKTSTVFVTTTLM